jgi:hypothetical protein
MQTTKLRAGNNTSMRQMVVDMEDELDADLMGTQLPSGDREGRDIDPDALAFIKAKRKVDDLQKAKKYEKRIGGAAH